MAWTQRLVDGLLNSVKKIRNSPCFDAGFYYTTANMLSSTSTFLQFERREYFKGMCELMAEVMSGGAAKLIDE